MSKDRTNSIVTVDFNDGQVGTYHITASPKIAQYLMREAAHTGLLVMRNDLTGEVWCIPIARIKECKFVGDDTAPHIDTDTGEITQEAASDAANHP
jgi:hypothetical protein